MISFTVAIYHAKKKVKWSSLLCWKNRNRALLIILMVFWHINHLTYYYSKNNILLFWNVVIRADGESKWKRNRAKRLREINAWIRSWSTRCWICFLISGFLYFASNLHYCLNRKGNNFSVLCRYWRLPVLKTSFDERRVDWKNFNLL